MAAAAAASVDRGNDVRSVVYPGGVVRQSVNSLSVRVCVCVWLRRGGANSLVGDFQKTVT